MLALIALTAMAAYPTPVEHDFVVHDFKFDSGQTLETLNLHCTTVGEPRRNPKTGKIDNAILVMHGTGGNSHSLLAQTFADVLYGPGQLLDATKYFIILPDAIGHGHSSKPSDGMHARFPNYRYHDIVRAQHMLVFDLLKVDHLRLVIGTSMGGMQSWMWGEMYPDAMDALMPLACAPVQIAGRNRWTRKMAINAIRTDPGWMDGEYKEQPRGLLEAVDMLILMGSAPLFNYKQAPTREHADALLERSEHARLATADANDTIYQLEASEDYNPEPDLEKIQAPLTAVNSADDFINPPELGIVERLIKRVKKGEFVLLPISDKTRGHGTHTIASIWKDHLEELMKRSGG